MSHLDTGAAKPYVWNAGDRGKKSGLIFGSHLHGLFLFFPFSRVGRII